MELKINNQLNFVNEWLSIKKLSLNVDKSNYVIFSSSQRQIHYSIKIFINEVELKERKSIKYLGVIIDKNLKWKDHIHELSKKIAKSIGILSKLRHFVQKSTLIQLYYSIIYPFLIYGVTVWGNTYQSNVSSLITLQKKAVRIINFSSFKEHVQFSSLRVYIY